MSIAKKILEISKRFEDKILSSAQYCVSEEVALDCIHAAELEIMIEYERRMCIDRGETSNSLLRMYEQELNQIEFKYEIL